MEKWVATGMVLLGIIVFADTAAANERTWKIDSIGLDLQYGRDSAEDLQPRHSLNIVERISVRAESDSLMPYLLDESWDKWTAGAELHYSSHKANERPDNGQDTGFHEIGVNGVLKRHFFDKMFYIGGLAGLSYVHDMPRFENRPWKSDDRRSNIGRSHCLYTVGALAGRDWQVLQTAWSVRTELRLTHSSDPFHADHGKNFAAGVLGATYRY